MFTVKWSSAALKHRLQGQFINKWAANINNSSKGQTYRIYKQNFGFEKYFCIRTTKIENRLHLINSEHN